MKRAGVGAVLLVIVLAIAYLSISKNDICTDKIRGFKESASSSVEGIREALSKVSATLKIDKAYQAAQSFEKLNPADFVVLRACDTQCALLTQCLRFVIFSSPSQACPREYDDLQKQTQAAAILLGELEQMRSKASSLIPVSDKVAELQLGIEELEKSSGSTGGQLAVLKSQLAAEEQSAISGIDDVTTSLATISSSTK
ncbi:hypothetical protein HFO45_14950 [Rhizobium leguminosarum]|uniref:hypothetical protein n=1 Tax=Rhizobium leguminosarum TaxID=384 RepID=UPI001C943FA1|nr:hypothetical protein [Rhizobium leguminosarum]MBY5649557.1 hypothetical protein [Rhizobium leguminosarum]